MKFSHDKCSHPATKSARAKCRRTIPTGVSLRKFAEEQLGWDIVALRLDEDNAKELRETIAQATGLDYPTRLQLEQEIGHYLLRSQPAVMTDADEVKSLQDEVDAAKAEKIGKRVTPENWRDFRGMDVEIEMKVWGAQPNHRVRGQIIAWGTQYMTYVVPFYGTRNRVPTEKVLQAICVK